MEQIQAMMTIFTEGSSDNDCSGNNDWWENSEGVMRWSHGKSLSPNGDDTNQTLEQSPNADTAPVLGNWFAIKLRATGKQCTTKITWIDTLLANLICSTHLFHEMLDKND
jgi:hypothetical protein